jgi:nickel/cobalt transporter (NicO) family protein
MRFITDHFSDLNRLLFLAPSFVLGIAHGLEPLHTRAFLGMNSAGPRGWTGAVAVLGISAGLSHLLMLWVFVTIGTHAANHLQPANLLPWCQFLSAILTTGVAIWLLIQTLRPVGSGALEAQGDQSEVNDERSGVRSVTQMALLGILSGITPCPLTVGVLLGSTQTGSLGLGASVVTGLGAGLALAMTGFGVATAWAVSKATPHLRNPSLVRLLISLVSCAVLLVLAALMATQGWRALNN